LSPASDTGSPSAPGCRVLGTAGHIDHGKTALIRALTGVDTDRLPEEKKRGITIDLGFAPLDLPGGLRASVVDVPGHEGLVRTMISGATGIDVVLLVVAADEGVMPQTREHVAICQLLGLTRGIVALTKIDAASDDVAELAADEVRELLAGTALADAPLVRVSAVTGDGVEELREELVRVLSEADPRTPRCGPARLAIDRTFAMKGFGTVATGTLVGGALKVGQAVEVQPSGLRGRVRGLQCHGQSAERVEPGVRCAVNLQGVELSDLSRGQVIAAPDALAPTASVDVALHWLAAAPRMEGAVAVEFLAGTAERRARVAPIAADVFAPGGDGFARIHVEGPPLAVLPGDRFIVRGFARTEMGGATLGGGVILDVAPPHRRRSDPALLGDLEVLARGDPVEGLAVRIRRSGLEGIDESRLGRETGLESSLLESALAALASDGRAVRAQSNCWLDAAAIESLETRLLSALNAYHEAEPIRPGMSRSALRGGLPDNVARDVAELVIDRLDERGDVEIDRGLVRRAGRAPVLAAEDEAIIEKISNEARTAGLEPPSLRDWSQILGLPAERLGDLLAHCERTGVLVRAPGDLWFDREAVDALRERVVAHLREHETLDTQTYKALIGTSRRTAVPLMELFDAEHLTIRQGQVRKLRQS
jgi:selenocysteine-specific elongation factor